MNDRVSRLGTGVGPWLLLGACVWLFAGCQSPREASRAPGGRDGEARGEGRPSAAAAATEGDQAWMKSGAAPGAERRTVSEVRLDDGGLYSGSMIGTNGGLVAHGEGFCVWPDGRRQEGQWSFGKPHGHGVTRTPGGDVFEGEFRDGLRDGDGKLTMAGGAVLAGPYRADKAHGPFRITDGPFVLQGRFEEGKMVGWWKRQGTLGTDVEEWVEDGARTRARGLVVFEDGVRQSGEWDFRGATGKGEIRWPDGRRYQGTWRAVDGEANDPEGAGEMTWSDGRRYVGEFVKGQREGQGRMTYPDGRVENGRWKNDQFVGDGGVGR